MKLKYIKYIGVLITIILGVLIINSYIWAMKPLDVAFVIPSAADYVIDSTQADNTQKITHSPLRKKIDGVYYPGQDYWAQVNSKYSQPRPTPGTSPHCGNDLDVDSYNVYPVSKGIITYITPEGSDDWAAEDNLARVIVTWLFRRGLMQMGKKFIAEIRIRS